MAEGITTVEKAINVTIMISLLTTGPRVMEATVPMVDPSVHRLPTFMRRRETLAAAVVNMLLVDTTRGTIRGLLRPETSKRVVGDDSPLPP